MRLFVLFSILVSVNVDWAHNLHHCVQAAWDPALVRSYRRETRMSLRVWLVHTMPITPVLNFLFSPTLLYPDHPVAARKCYRDYGFDQWEDSHHDQPVSGRLDPSHQSPVNAPERHRGPSGHGRLCQVWEGKMFRDCSRTWCIFVGPGSDECIQ